MESNTSQALNRFREEWLGELQGRSNEQSELLTATADQPSAQSSNTMDPLNGTAVSTVPTDENFNAESTTSTAVASDLPAWLKEAQATHDLSQDLAAGSITVRPATISDPVRKHDLPPQRVRVTWKKGKTAEIFSRQPGKPDRYLNTLPVDAVRALSSVFDDAVARSGLASHKVNKLVFPVNSDDQSEALATDLVWQREIVYSDTCYVVAFKRITQLPTYRYYRLAQIFRASGKDHQRREMLQRIQSMKYKGGWYRPAIDDIEAVIRFIPPEHDIRRGMMKSIAEAWLDRRLGNEKDIDKLWAENEEFRAEIDAAVEEASKERVKKSKKAS